MKTGVPLPIKPGVATVLALFFTLLAFVAVELMATAILLNLGGQTARADVTSAERRATARRSAASSYRLIYRFRLDGSDAWHRSGGLFASDVGVRRQVWEEARRTGTIDVEYVPGASWMSRPSSHTPLEGWFCSGLAGTVLSAIAVVLHMRAWREVSRWEQEVIAWAEADLLHRQTRGTRSAE